jgi:hypothetical protein
MRQLAVGHEELSGKPAALRGYGDVVPNEDPLGRILPRPE